MGSGASGLATEIPGGDLRLPASGLRFSINQLRTLNSHVDTLWEEDQKGRVSIELESAVESLVQRIVDGAGQRDARFRCCHIIALHRGKKMRSRSLEYLVTLDSLPPLNSGDECTLQNGPVGYGRIRLTGKEADKWDEFVTPAGYLCRDKVVEHWVSLVARVAQARGGGGSRVLDARAAPHANPYTYCYLERGTSPHTGTDRRLAIVEGAAWVMVRVGAGEAEAKLMLGARVQGCSPAAYTCRVPLAHPLALLHYTAAQTGYHAVAVGPPSTLVCGDRSSTWQLWHPGLEAELDAHCCERSVVARIAGALNCLIDRMREGAYQGTLRVVSRYIGGSLLRRRLYSCSQYQQAAARACVSEHSSHQLLLVLDELYSTCERGGISGFIYPVLRGSLARRGARDADWQFDAVCIKSCLLQLHSVVGEEIPPTPTQILETALFSKWENINRSTKVIGSVVHSRRQLKYIAEVGKQLLKCKSMMPGENHSTFKANLIQITSQGQEDIEELVHMMAIMLDQARDLYMNNLCYSSQQFDRQMSAYRSKKWNKLKDYYDASSACLIDAVRRDPDLRQVDLKDQTIAIKHILKWLYKGAKEDKKYLGPVLKPYLDGLYNSSMENSWFLEEFEEKKCMVELDGLKEYCMGVHDGSIEPCMGILDAAKKFAWAKAMVDLVDRFKYIDFRIVFPTGDGMAVSYPARLPSYREHRSARTLTLSRRHKAAAKLRLATRCVLGAFSTALLPDICPKPRPITRHESTDILTKVKNGNYVRTSKPDIISSTDLPTLRRSRRRRPATAYGFPEISLTSQSDSKTIRRKYHTLKSLVYEEPVESIKELRQRPRSAGSTVRNKEGLSRPSILETLDFINSVKDALCVEDSCASDNEDSPWSSSDEWVVGQAAPLNLASCRPGASHLLLADLLLALLRRGNFSMLQELCPLLGEGSEGALFALHRLARAARSRSSERASSAWRLPEPAVSEEGVQRYRARAQDYVSGDEAPPPPPLPRHASFRTQVIPTDYHPPNRMQLAPRAPYTGIINPIYDIKIPKNKFEVKRSKSLGRTFSSSRNGIDIIKYNISLGNRSGKRTNDVLTAISSMTGETGVGRMNGFQKSEVVGDSYRISRVTID